MRMRAILPVVTGFWPIIAVHTTYAIAVAEGYVPLCNPYIDSCTSISETGRNGTAYFFFKATMIPAAAMFAIFWREAHKVLRELGDSVAAARWVVGLGVTAAVFLVVYTVALGSVGEYFQLQRRIGIILFFSLTAFSELLFTWRIGKLGLRDPTRPYQLSICYSFLIMGIFSVALDATLGESYEEVEDAFEWILAIIMQSYFLLMYFCWRTIAPQRAAAG